MPVTSLAYLEQERPRRLRTRTSVVRGHSVDMIDYKHFDVGLRRTDLQAELALQRLQHRLTLGRLFARLRTVSLRRPGELDVVHAFQSGRIDHRTRCAAANGEPAFEHLR